MEHLEVISYKNLHTGIQGLIVVVFKGDGQVGTCVDLTKLNQAMFLQRMIMYATFCWTIISFTGKCQGVL